MSKPEHTQKLTPSEALYGFAGWLSSRKQATHFGSCYGAGVIADLVDDYCKSQKLAEPRDNFHTFLAPYPEDR